MDEPRSSTSGGPASTSRNAPQDEVVESHEGGHGSSPASWTLVGLVMLGSLILCLAVVFWSLALTVAGIAVIVAGLVAGRVLATMGYGVTDRH